MARDRLLPAPLGWIHPVNATPGRGVILLAAVAIIVPGVLIVRGLSLSDGMDYLMQIASFGFIGGYLLVCVAAPCYLRRQRLPCGRQVAVSAVALVVLGAVLGLSVYPLPPAPVRYLPLSFAALLLAGTALSAWVRGRASPLTSSPVPRPPGSPAHPSASPEIAACDSPIAGRPAGRCPRSRRA
jgi:amino acid transporter